MIHISILQFTSYQIDLEGQDPPPISLHGVTHSAWARTSQHGPWLSSAEWATLGRACTHGPCTHQPGKGHTCRPGHPIAAGKPTHADLLGPIERPLMRGGWERCLRLFDA